MPSADVAETSPRSVFENTWRLGYSRSNLLPLRPVRFALALLILPARPLVEPFRFPECAVRGRRQDAPRKLLHAHMERMVREEVRRVHPVLAVCILRDIFGTTSSALTESIDRELHLDEYFRQIDLLLPAGSVNRRRCLSAVHDLQVPETRDHEPTIGGPNRLSTFRSSGDAVVVGEEHSLVRSRSCS